MWFLCFLWLLLFAGVTLDHAVEGASIDAEDLGGAGAIAAREVEDVKQVAVFQLIEHGQIFEECGKWQAGCGAYLGRLEFLRQVFRRNRVTARVQHAYSIADSSSRTFPGQL